MRCRIQCPIAVLQETVLPHMLSDDCMNSKPVLSLQSRRISTQAGKSTVKDLHNVLVEVIAAGINEVFKLEWQDPSPHRKLVQHHIVFRGDLTPRNLIRTGGGIIQIREWYLSHVSFANVAVRFKEVRPGVFVHPIPTSRRRAIIESLGLPPNYRFHSPSLARDNVVHRL